MREIVFLGLHPNADRIMKHVAGRGLAAQKAACQLGRQFLVLDGEPEFARRLAVAFRDHNAEVGAHRNATIEPRDLRGNPDTHGDGAVRRGIRPAACR